MESNILLAVKHLSNYLLIHFIFLGPHNLGTSIDPKLYMEQVPITIHTYTLDLSTLGAFNNKNDNSST